MLEGKWCSIASRARCDVRYVIVSQTSFLVRRHCHLFSDDPSNMAASDVMCKDRFTMLFLIGSSPPTPPNTNRPLAAQQGIKKDPSESSNRQLWIKWHPRPFRFRTIATLNKGLMADIPGLWGRTVISKVDGLTGYYLHIGQARPSCIVQHRGKATPTDTFLCQTRLSFGTYRPHCTL